MRRALCLALCLIALLNLSACFDANEIDNLMYVVAVGVDLGVSDKWRLTLQIPNLKNEASQANKSEQSADSGDGYDFVTVDAPSFFTGINMLNAAAMRRLNFSHTQIIVFSEELAKSGKIGEYLAPINRFMEIRRTSSIFVVRGSAMEFLRNNEPSVGTSISKSLELIGLQAESTGYFPDVNLEEFYHSIKSSTYQAIAGLAGINRYDRFQEEGEPWGDGYKKGGDYVAGEMPRSGDNTLELFGTAVFDGDRMVGQLTGDETRLLLMIRGDFRRCFYTFQDPQAPELIIPMDVTRTQKPVIRVTFGEDGRPRIHLKVLLDGEILAVQSRINYEEGEMKVLLEETFKSLIQEDLEKLIEKCQGMDTDVFRFGDYAARRFKTITQLEDYNWNRHFREAEVTVEVSFIIRRAGTQIRSNPISDSEGKE